MIGAWFKRLSVQETVGVDVGSSLIKTVVIGPEKDRYALKHAAVTPLESHSREHALRSLLHSCGLNRHRIVIGIASPEAIVRPFQFPKMPRKELAGALKLEAEAATLNGHLPHEMAVDWQSLESGKDSIRGLLAVVPKEILAKHVKIAESAGCRPAVVDVQGLALWNAYWLLEGSHEPASKTVCLMNIGRQTTNLVLAKGADELILLRDIQLGAEALEEGLENEWFSEIHDSLAYARARSSMRSIDFIHVTGGGATPHTIKLIQAMLHVDTTLWNPLERLAIETGDSLEISQGPLFAVAAGLALRKS